MPRELGSIEHRANALKIKKRHSVESLSTVLGRKRHSVESLPWY
jgi:hypothetical protein